MEELSHSMQRIGAAVYGAQQQPGGEPGPSGEGGKGDEGTVEGEFREV